MSLLLSPLICLIFTNKNKIQLSYSEDLIAIEGVGWDCRGLRVPMVEILLQGCLRRQLETSCGWPTAHGRFSGQLVSPRISGPRESTQDRSTVFL